MRLNERGGVRRRRAVGDVDRVTIPRRSINQAWRSGTCSCSCCCASRGCTWCTSCRAGRSDDRRVLPRPAPGVIPSHARARLLDGRGRRWVPAAHREDPRAAPAARRPAGPDPGPASARTSCPYTTTTLERDLALELGSRCTARTHGLFRPRDEDRVPAHVRGGGRRPPPRVRGRRRARDVLGALPRCGRAPDAKTAIVKLNEGVAGTGNAVVDLVGLPRPGAADEAGGCPAGSRG